MKIAVHDLSRKVLESLLSQHRDGKSRLLWKKYDYQLPPQDRTDAAVPLLNQLSTQPCFLHINGDQRDLLLRLLAWAAISNGEWDEIMETKLLLRKLQPEGVPIGAEIGDFVVFKPTKRLVEIVHFEDPGDEGYDHVTESSYYFIVCEVSASTEKTDIQFLECSLDDLQWPTRRSTDEVIWGPSYLAA